MNNEQIERKIIEYCEKHKEDKEIWASDIARELKVKPYIIIVAMRNLNKKVK